VAISASAAPLYQQQVDLFEELLQREDAASAKASAKAIKAIVKAVAKDTHTTVKAIVKGVKQEANPLPFDHITTKQKAVYALDKRAHDKYNTYESTKTLAPFKVSAARDKAENGERKVQDVNIKTARTAMDKAQMAVDDMAVKTDKQADKQATETKEKEMETIHKILHPHQHEEEVSDKDFLGRMAKQAAGASVVINDDTEGNFFRPGGLGDHADFHKKEDTTTAVKDAVKAAVKDQVAKAIAKVAKAKADSAIAKDTAKAKADVKAGRDDDRGREAIAKDTAKAKADVKAGRYDDRGREA